MTDWGSIIFSVHVNNGWLAISAGDSEAHIRLMNFMDWLNANYPKRHEFITELGEPVVLNNGIEFAVTYSLMLFSLVFTGAGKYLSLDYWIKRFTSHSKGCQICHNENLEMA